MKDNNKGTTILLTVIGVATLLVAVVGATFAYFTAQVKYVTPPTTAACPTITGAKYNEATPAPAPIRAPAPMPIRTPAKTFWSLAAAVKPPYTPPITPPTIAPTSKATKIALCPLGS